MAELITMFLSGLTERSQYAITLKEADRRGKMLAGLALHANYPR